MVKIDHTNLLHFNFLFFLFNATIAVLRGSLTSANSPRFRFGTRDTKLPSLN